MTDNVQNDEEKISDFAKQRAKFKQELDAKDSEIANLKAQILSNKKSYFKNTLASQGYDGDFDDFADKYAENLEIEEMVALYNGTFGWPKVQEPSSQEPSKPTIPTIWPKSIIGTNPIGDKKDFSNMSSEEMIQWGKSHPEIFW